MSIKETTENYRILEIAVSKQYLNGDESTIYLYRIQHRETLADGTYGFWDDCTESLTMLEARIKFKQIVLSTEVSEVVISQDDLFCKVKRELRRLP